MLKRASMVAGCALALAALSASASEEPLWEAGLGVGALAFPDYRGADEGSVYPVPMPYFVYRGEFLKADDNGLRGRLFNRDYAELSFSFNGTVPVDSEDNAARLGMPDLEPTIELGPSLDLHLWKSADRTVKLDLVLPLRAPFTLESSPQSIGWVFSPRINLDVEDIGGAGGWKFGVGAGPAFADSKYHAYFYDVAPAYETPERPGYRSSSGYSGAYMITSMSKRYPRYWVGAFLRYDMLSGAEFEDSPLVRRSTSLFGGVGIAWIIGRSKRMVNVEE
jgi:outer membrane scaffolding protein for murein synthesis (MipA/OmpV family)